ncbi:MAG: acyl-CoA dehydrogenase family protein [Myxococcota bacterium]
MEPDARFFQSPPTLDNQWDADPLFRELLGQKLPPDLLSALTPELRHLGELGGGALYQHQLEDLANEPVLTQWDAWGHRVDHIELTSLWKRAQVLTAEHGLIADGYDAKLGPYARLVQFAKNYMVQASLDVWSCPLAMTDGAARTLLDLENPALIAHALPRLTSRDPKTMWTSGQWMTERTGGSDVSRTETIAKKEGDSYRLYGTKWFTSATTAEMALTLARPEGNPEGSRGLAIFFVELRDEAGRLQNIEINRLKDKLGTRKVPTAELRLRGVPATAVSGTTDGVKKITSMLNITRLWNSMGATWSARRAVALAQAYSSKRVAFGALLKDKPLHLDTLASMVAESLAITAFSFRLAELVGKAEAKQASPSEKALLRALTPIAKLTTGKQVVSVCSEAIECFGGAGYVEDTGLPRLLADAQVLPIWEGTTNVLSADTMRAMMQEETRAAMDQELDQRLAALNGPAFAGERGRVAEAIGQARGFFKANMGDAVRLEAGARQYAMTLGRSYQALLLLEHASVVSAATGSPRAAAAARRFIAEGLSAFTGTEPSDAALLVS